MKKILALTLALLMLVTVFAGCGKEEPASPATPAPSAEPTPVAPAEPDEVGYWTLLRTEGEETMDEEDVKSLKEMGTLSFAVAKDDVGASKIKGYFFSFFWADNFEIAKRIDMNCVVLRAVLGL